MRTAFYIFIICLFVSSCKDYYNDNIDWMTSIKPGSSLDSVKKSQPFFVEVDWKNPEIYKDSSKSYYITKIKGSYDILKMSHSLVFKDDKFQYRRSMK
jgi:hypothetical protein